MLGVSIDKKGIIHLAETNKTGLSLQELKQLKSALIITGKYEPSSFMKCIKEKLCAFIRAPIYLVKDIEPQSTQDWTLKLQPADFIFKKVDLMTDQHLCHLELDAIEKMLMEYNVIFFTFNTGGDGWSDQVSNILKRKLMRNELAVVFLRGNRKSVPMKLGFTEENPDCTDYINTTNLRFCKTYIKKTLKQKSISLFLDKYGNSDDDDDEIIELSKGFTFLCGMESSLLIKKDDWHILANSTDNSDVYSWIVQKTMKVMFIPWYGFSHGIHSLYDLILYSLRFLLYEHLEPEWCGSDRFKNKLLLMLPNNKLCDIDVMFTSI